MNRYESVHLMRSLTWKYCRANKDKHFREDNDGMDIYFKKEMTILKILVVIAFNFRSSSIFLIVHLLDIMVIPDLEDDGESDQRGNSLWLMI